MEETTYLVVGAGISGLSFADWVKGEDYLVVEALHEMGGYCRTVKQDGFVWDFSGHFFHFRRPEIESYLVDRMKGQRVLKVQKDSRIYGDRYIDFPFQKNIHQLPQEEFIDCLYDLYFKEGGEPAHFKDMLYKKFGKSIAEKFLVPYNEKLYATDLARLDVDAMGRFFPYANVDEIIAGFRRPDNASYNSSFTYPEGGAIQYVEALAQGVKSDRIALNERVLSVDLETRVATTNKRQIRYQHLVTSAPFDRTLSMCGISYDPEVYDFNKVLVFNLGFDRKGPEGIHWLYVPQREVSFYRIGFYDNIFGTDRMSMYVELGRPRDFEVTPEIIESARRQVLEDLRKIGVVTDHNLVSEHHVLLDPAYVHITKDSINAVQDQKEYLSQHGVHTMGRYGSWTYCSIEDNIVEARELAENLSF